MAIWAVVGMPINATICPVHYGAKWRWYPPAMYNHYVEVFTNQVALGIPFGWSSRKTGTLASGGGESWG